MKIILIFLSIVFFVKHADCQVVDIPDSNFKAVLIDDPQINTNGDAEIQVAEAEAFTGTLNISLSQIADLTGIASFVALTTLHCFYNQLTNLDLSANVALTTLTCFDNQLTNLDLSTNSALG